MLAGGTTAGVLAFCAVPVVGVVRSGFSLRPRLDRQPTDGPPPRPAKARGRRVYLAMTQVLLAVVLVLANRIAGGVVAYQVAFTLFLLPHALFAVPALTALYPRLFATGDRARVERVRRIGRSRHRRHRLLHSRGHRGADRTGRAVGPSRSLRRQRRQRVGGGGGHARLRPWNGRVRRLPLPHAAFYAVNDARTPALANTVVVTGGAGAMVTAFIALRHPDVGVLAVTHSAVYLVGAAGLFSILARRRLASGRGVARVLLAHAVSAAAAGAAMAGVVALVDRPGRTGALVATVAAGLAGLVVLVVARTILRPPGRVCCRTSWLPAVTDAGVCCRYSGRRPAASANTSRISVRAVDRTGMARRDRGPGRRARRPGWARPCGADRYVGAAHPGGSAALRRIMPAFDIVHAHGLTAGWTTSLARRGATPRLVVTVHNVVLDEAEGRAAPFWRARNGGCPGGPTPSSRCHRPSPRSSAAARPSCGRWARRPSRCGRRPR